MVAAVKTMQCVILLGSNLQVGGPYWEVPLGRRDSLGASIQGSNNDIPAPNNTLRTIVTKFKRQGLNVVDVVALSGDLLAIHGLIQPSLCLGVLTLHGMVRRWTHHRHVSVHQLPPEAVQPDRQWHG